MTSITFYGGAGSVTGANFLFEIGDQKVLVDCGLSQGTREAEAENYRDFDYDPASIDLLFITHSHIDHIGRVPKLTKDGFRGEIISTPETKDIAKVMLADMVKLNRGKNLPAGKAGDSLFNPDDVEKSLSLWHTLPYHSIRDFPPSGQGRAGGGFKVELYDAGHILGSAIIKFMLRSSASDAKKPGFKSIIFSGDLGNSPSLLLKDTEKVGGADYLVMESVYGDRNHERREEREGLFREIVASAIERGGALLIPAFSLERTQAVLYMLDNLFESGKLPSVPVFLDSPLASRVTRIYERVTKHYNSEVQRQLSAGDNIFEFPRLRETAQVRDSHEILGVSGPKIIIAGSGMSTGGRILGHEAAYLPDPKATILFLGYQAPGTLGREIEEGARKITINNQQIPIRAHVEKISGFSAHGDSDALVRFASHSKDSLKKVFVAMGEPRASIYLSQRLRDELGVEAVVPERGKMYELK